MIQFDPFDKGRHIYTFTNKCLEDESVLLEDETYKVFLNTKGHINDTDEEMLEFLGYVEHSNDEYVKHTKSKLVKEIHQKVRAVKEDQRMEVEYMTLLERDREKFEEGMEQGIEKEKIDIAKRMLELKLPIETIEATTGLTKGQIEQIR